MSWQSVDPARVAAGTPLYRINDFFSVADMVNNGRLFVPSAASFDDSNEGIERLFGALDAASGFCGGALVGFASTARIETVHHWHKASHYVSCWTRTMESVAMWGLYSQDMCGVQMATTAERLAHVGEQHSRQFGADPTSLAQANDGQVFITSTTLVPVEYEALMETHRRIERRGRAIARLRDAGRVRQYEPGDVGKLSARDAARERVYRVAPFALKDRSFAHESEVRLVLRATQADSEGLAEARGALSADAPLAARLQLAIHDLELCALHKLLPVPQSTFIEVPSDFITEVRIDPRCPPHKRAFMEAFFRSAGIPVRRSECFGYLPDYADFRDPRHRT